VTGYAAVLIIMWFLCYIHLYMITASMTLYMSVFS